MKKDSALFEECEKEFFENAKAKNCSEKLVNYVWSTLLRVQKGYSFNKSHTLAYSLVALQEMNLAYRFPRIFWDCACLITDTGGDDKTSTNYDKIAAAIGKMKSEGINITPPNINKSSYNFEPDPKNNCIYFGLSGILNVGDDVIEAVMANRPYKSVQDFIERVKIKKPAMMSLIKGGAFDDLMERRECMKWFILQTCDQKNELNLRNMAMLLKYNLLPIEEEPFDKAYRIYEFNKYLKANCKENAINYKLDDRANEFLMEIEMAPSGDKLPIKAWDKFYKKVMDVFRFYIAGHKAQLLQEVNSRLFNEDWDKYAKGNFSAWEMEVLCYYDHEHELKNVNNFKYGLSDYAKLPEEPVVDRVFYKAERPISLFKLTKICGTVIAKNKDKALVTLLTTSGVVTVKFRKDYFALFDSQISEIQPDGTKKVIEKSWFNRGSKIIVQGVRSGDVFIAKKYATTGGHQLYKITEVLPNGEIVIQTQRSQGGI